MYDPRFDFSVEKLVRAIAYFSKRGVPDLTKLKIGKLLYFADKHHLLSQGRPILGDVYFCMELGPVPSYSLNVIDSAFTRPEVPVEDDAKVNLFHKVLKVKKLFYWNYPRLEAQDESYSTDIFSKSELDSLEQTVRTYGHKTAKELVDLTHAEPTWVLANQKRRQGSSTPIPYDLFFEGATEEARRLWAQVVAEHYGVAIPLAGDVEYAAFANELASYDFTPDEIAESDLRSKSPYSRV
jgi:uncharacterized phage-associated protein